MRPLDRSGYTDPLQWSPRSISNGDDGASAAPEHKRRLCDINAKGSGMREEGRLVRDDSNITG